MAQNWNIDPENGDYIMSNGAPVQTDSLTVPAYFRLKIKRTRWLYAPNDQYGSDFYLLKKRPKTGQESIVQNVALRALQPIVDDGRAIAVSVGASETSIAQRSNLALEVAITDAQGKVQNLNLPALSVGGAE